jgi:hypothetical protein
VLQIAKASQPSWQSYAPKTEPTRQEIQEGLAAIDVASAALRVEQSNLSAEQKTAIAAVKQLYLAWRRHVPRELQMQMIEAHPDDGAAAERTLRQHYEQKVLPGENARISKTFDAIPAELRGGA